MHGPGFKLDNKFREKFYLSPRKFGRSFDLNFMFAYVFYTSAENKEKFVHLGDYFSLVAL